MGNVCTGVRRGETMGREIGNRDRKGLHEASRTYGSACEALATVTHSEEIRAMGARNRDRTGVTPAKHTGAIGHVRGNFPAPLTSFSLPPPRPRFWRRLRCGDKEDTTGHPVGVAPFL